MQITNRKDVAGNRRSQVEAPPSDALITWKPQWLIDVDHDEVVGLTTRDGCFVVLVRKPNLIWEPTTHIPRQAAERMAQLLPGIPSK